MNLTRYRIDLTSNFCSLFVLSCALPLSRWFWSNAFRQLLYNIALDLLDICWASLPNEPACVLEACSGHWKGVIFLDSPARSTRNPQLFSFQHDSFQYGGLVILDRGTLRNSQSIDIPVSCHLRRKCCIFYIPYFFRKILKNLQVLTAMIFKTTVFWVVTTCNIGDGYQGVGEIGGKCAFILMLEMAEGLRTWMLKSVFLRNIGIHLQFNTVAQFRAPQSWC